ncbi:MAG: CehA/McbA family metallohydrolase [Bacillota bacterium]|nr:CehA/McbA family metallohydrolase [Bacillota bacterium]
MNPNGIMIVTPMVVALETPISIKVKLLGPVREIKSRGDYNTKKPRLYGQYNFNQSRGILYRDHVLPEWTGTLLVDGGPDLVGPSALSFDGKNQGVFPGDTRPIGVFSGWSWRKPGFHWIRLTDPVSGMTAFSNPVLVTADCPQRQIFWGDPHWQSFFTDGIRCPEELYAFARDEAFLDFGALSDHTEGLTDRQWQYFTDVTNDYNASGSFATLVGQEWTSMKWGHRNIYYRGDSGPILRSDDPDQDTLQKIWSQLIGHEAIAIPHHSANVAMGVDWQNGWNPDLEPAVEIHSVWGSSEYPGLEGNPQPIKVSGGEKPGQHVIDALKRGYRFGFVGGGDIHDGRPGDDLHSSQESPAEYFKLSAQGFTAAITSRLDRESIYDAIKARATYATTRCRIYLDVSLAGTSMGQVVKLSDLQGRTDKVELALTCAAPETIDRAVLIQNGREALEIKPGSQSMLIQEQRQIDCPQAGDFLYFRIITENGNMAWSSPIWIDA